MINAVSASPRRSASHSGSPIWSTTSRPCCALSICRLRYISSASRRRVPKRSRASLVLCTPAPAVDASRAEQLENVPAQDEREGMRSILPTMLARSYPPELSDPRTYERYRGRYIANDPVGFALAFRVLARTDKRPSLGAIACPTMVVAGRQDLVRPVAVTQEIAQRIPGARFEVIDAGHMMPVTAPEALLALLLDFLPR